MEKVISILLENHPRFNIMEKHIKSQHTFNITSMTTIQFNKIFDFNNIKKDTEIDENLNQSNFLAAIPISKNHGKIERNGDILFAIRNHGIHDIKMNINAHETPYNYLNKRNQSIFVKAGDTVKLECPIIMAALYRTNDFYYNYTIENNENTLFDFLCKKELSGIEFIYGYFTSHEERMMLRQKNLYYLDEKGIELYSHGQHSDWIYTVCYLYPQEINQKYYHNYMNHLYKDEELIIKFKELNPDWIEVM